MIFVLKMMAQVAFLSSVNRKGTLSQRRLLYLTPDNLCELGACLRLLTKHYFYNYALNQKYVYTSHPMSHPMREEHN